MCVWGGGVSPTPLSSTQENNCCFRIHLHSDTVCPEAASDSTGSVPLTALPSGANPKSRLFGICASDQLAADWKFPGTLFGLYSYSLLEESKGEARHDKHCRLGSFPGSIHAPQGTIGPFPANPWAKEWNKVGGGHMCREVRVTWEGALSVSLAWETMDWLQGWTPM